MIKWKPEYQGVYYSPNVDNGKILVRSFKWDDSWEDEDLYEAGLVCKTKEEALELAEKMLAVVKEARENVE